MQDKIVESAETLTGGIRSNLASGMAPRFFLEIKMENAPITEVQDFTVREGVSRAFKIIISLVSESEIKFSNVIEKEALLTIKGDPLDRYFHGVIRKFELTGKNASGKYAFKAEIVPYFSLLSLEKDCRIRQNMNAQDIIAEVFDEGGITSDLYEFRFSNKSRLRKYCVQFNETDQEFVERISQEEGIFYFFEHHKDKHVMVFGEDRRDYIKLECDDRIRFMSNSGLNETEECVNTLDFSNRLSPDAFTHTNFNFKMPTVDLESKKHKQDEDAQKYEIYEYPGLYGYAERGDQLAKAQYNSQNSFTDRANGRSNSTRLIPGHMFTLANHDFDSFNKEYTAIYVSHIGQQSQVLEEAAEGGTTYSNTFFAIPSSINYSPLKTLEKPLMRGPQTAIVVGKDGDEICTDEYGRVKVQFHWDRKGEDNEKSSCWIRCAQLWGGGGWGTLFTPRVGDEVLVDFVNGDPDYPIIVGSIYNGDNMPLYDMKQNYTRTTIKTRSTPNSTGYNELRFEDKAGSEEVYLQGEKDWNILIKNDKGQTVGHDETLSVANNRTKNVGVNQGETIGANKNIQVGVNHSENIGANMTLDVGATKKETVGINSMETVGAAKELTVGGLYQVSVGGIMNETVIADKNEEVIGLKAVVVGLNMQEYVKVDRKSTVDGNFDESVKKKHSLSADEYILEANKITLKSGSSKIVMDGSSITITAAKVFDN